MDRDDTILDYLQNRLGPKDREKFEQDMAGDASLSSEVNVMRSVRAQLATGPRHENAEAVWTRLSNSIDAKPQPANENRRPWAPLLKYAAVATIAVAAWQLTIVPHTNGVSEGFSTATERAEAFVIQIKFAENVTIGDIGALLLPLEGRITDGPSALGLVRISFANAEVQQQALEVLTTRTDLVEFVTEQ
ncbi:MAG: hypothetical protein R8G34_16375 [Paracoccaceae bacterium]|nr:hypothetical protein [Paracoccaceae bacterium]